MKRACAFALIALAACSKPLLGPISEGLVSGRVSRGEALPESFDSESLDLQIRRDWTIRTADFDLDGDVDLLIDPRADSPKICWNDGQGSFTEITLVEAIGELDEVRIADFNADGYPDLAAVSLSQGIRIILNNGHAEFGPASQLSSPGSQIRHIAAADWDGMPGADLIWVSEQPNETCYGNFSAGNWSVRTLARNWATGFFKGLEVTDVNTDGRPDLVLIGSNTLLLQQEDGSLLDASLDDRRWQILAAGQLGGDEGCDLLVRGENESLTILSRTASGSWAEAGTFPLHGFLATAQLVDLDADGRIDLCVKQVGFLNMCGNAEGRWPLSNWQVLFHRADGWQLRESKPVDDVLDYPGVIARLDASPYPDLIVPDAKGKGFRLVRDPFRPRGK